MKDNGFVYRYIEPKNKFEKFSQAEIEQSVASIFEKQVSKYLNNLAVKEKNFSLTYTELNQSANRTARAILSKINKQGQPIILLFEQGINCLTSIFGVLKTGNF